MGRLVAKCFPSRRTLALADHTYVECGTGKKAWGCFGGKRGGRTLCEGVGSTRRADRIAERSETAGITCYLVNGVCHQAANRILLPSRIDVGAARGARVSEALFGLYGKQASTRRSHCVAPFHMHPGVRGDLGACVEAPVPDAVGGQPSPAYLTRVIEIYQRAGNLQEPAPDVAASFMLELFQEMTAFHLGRDLDVALSRRLDTVRRNIEVRRADLEAAYVNGNVPKAEFADRFDDITVAFQHDMAEVLTPGQYVKLFVLDRDDTVTLADPSIIGGADQ